jgi:hypothetical protein
MEKKMKNKPYVLRFFPDEKNELRFGQKHFGSAEAAKNHATINENIKEFHAEIWEERGKNHYTLNSWKMAFKNEWLDTNFNSKQN